MEGGVDRSRSVTRILEPVLRMMERRSEREVTSSSLSEGGGIVVCR